jgi:hypothetical protein
MVSAAAQMVLVFIDCVFFSFYWNKTRRMYLYIQQEPQTQCLYSSSLWPATLKKILVELIIALHASPCNAQRVPAGRLTGLVHLEHGEHSIYICT